MALSPIGSSSFWHLTVSYASQNVCLVPEAKRGCIYDQEARAGPGDSGLIARVYDDIRFRLLQHGPMC